MLELAELLVAANDLQTVVRIDDVIAVRNVQTMTTAHNAAHVNTVFAT